MQTLTLKDQYITNTPATGCFTLAKANEMPNVYLAKEEYPGVFRAATSLQEDLFRVTGNKSQLKQIDALQVPEGIIIGTLGKSPLIDKLAQNGQLDAGLLQGKWDTYVIQVIEPSEENANPALVIAGSNKRGTIYGIFDICRRMGVSPWHWWADVPVKKQEELYVSAGTYFSGEPAVKYRGFFINDEYPCLGELAHEKFGGFTHKLYIHVFELLLRLRGNYFWPAMWNDAFHDDDPENTRLADEMGVIMGTSHHEPLMRAWKEWPRYGKGPWDLETNREVISQYWKDSVRRQGDRECIMTVGMRGDGDEPLTEESRNELLNDILTTQRKIIEETTGKKARDVPQMWAVYKEVQEYYEKGASIPEDILIMLCDDNWGNIRKLPVESDRSRPGGYGLYYHFDYVGGPRNYKWMNSSPLARTWEQLHIAYEGGIKDLWIVNVGDIKPLEFPLSYFLDLAWNPKDLNFDDCEDYTKLWAQEQFGPDHAPEIAELITQYAHFNGRRKPELLSPATYSLIHYQEAEDVMNQYNALAQRAIKVKEQLPASQHDAYYQLVEFPIIACANLNELHIRTAQNRLYARQGRAMAKDMAQRVKELFKKDFALRDYYNQELAGGKWNHMMDQNHISYTYWQQPEEDVLPELQEMDIPEKAEMGVALEGSEQWWPQSQKEAILPEIIKGGSKNRYIELFNRGSQAWDYSIDTPDWIIINEKKGRIEKQKRISLAVDWEKLPLGEYQGRILIKGPECQVQVSLPVVHSDLSEPILKGAFLEENRCLSIEAEHFSRKIDPLGAQWQIIPGLSRTLSGVTTLPFSELSLPLTKDSGFLEYKIFLRTPGKIKITCFLSPTNNFTFTEGLRYGLSIDNNPAKEINIHGEQEDGKEPISTHKGWDKAAGDNVYQVTSFHSVETPGLHSIRFYFVDQGIVLQKIVIWTGSEQQTYLGPPESSRIQE